MAPRFWVGGTGTWDASDTTHWASGSGTAGGQSVPVAGDDVTFDGSSGGGTVTVNFGGTVSINSLTFGAFTGTLNFAANNNSVTLTGNVSGTGAVTRTFNMGNGTWTLSANNASWNFSTVTNLTFNANSSTLAFTGASPTGRVFTGGGLTYNIVTLSAATSSSFTINSSNTFNTLTISAPNQIAINSSTQTVTTLTNVTGSSSQQVLFTSFNGTSTISSANNWTGTWCGIQGYTFSGGGTFTAPSSFNFGGNTGIAITSPSGSGVVGVVGG